MRKIYVQNTHKGNKAKTKSMKPKLLETLPVGTLISFIGTRKLEFEKWTKIYDCGLDSLTTNIFKFTTLAVWT